jgi:hypothetical protein
VGSPEATGRGYRQGCCGGNYLPRSAPHSFKCFSPFPTSLSAESPNTTLTITTGMLQATGNWQRIHNRLSS